MALHLIKVCVGIGSIEELAAVQKGRRRPGDAGSPHITRHRPKRADEILDGGSLYWIIKRAVAVRQRILAIEELTTEEGRRCRLILDKVLVATVPWPRRPHQGWRYLAAADAPPDLATQADGSGGEMPPREMIAELKRLGLM